VKIPFEQTVTGGYRFVFSNILSIIGIGWLPFLLFAAVVVGAVVTAMPLFNGLMLEGTNQIDSARLGAVMGQMIGSFVLVLTAGVFAQAMVNVGLMRKALGLHPDPVFVFFSLGSQVWQLIGSYLLLLLLAWCSIALVGGAIAALSVVLQKSAPDAQILVTVLLVIAAYIFFIYAMVRISFFIPAVVVAENHIGLRRAWRLGKGNFWRIIGIVLAVLLPLGFAVSTITQVMMRFAIGEQAVLSPNASQAEVQAYLAKVMAALIKIGPYFAAVEVLYLILLSALLAGASAVAYKLVTGADTAAARTFA